MTKESIKAFFDEHAANWDAEMIRHDDVINMILNNAKIHEGCSVLDIACGTGVLIPDYLDRKVKSVLGVDISDEMLKIAKSKFTQDNVDFVCEDAENYDFKNQFDAIMIYNAFPHFPNPEQLISHLSSFLKVGGTLTVAHGMSREKINAHHEGCAKNVSMGLMDTDQLVKIFIKTLKVDTVISDDKMYQVTGIKA